MSPKATSVGARARLCMWLCACAQIGQGGASVHACIQRRPDPSSWGAAPVIPPVATRWRQKSKLDPICLVPCPALAHPIHQLLPPPPPSTFHGS